MKDWLQLNIDIHNAGKSLEAFDLLCKFLNEKKDILLVQRLQEELESFYEIKIQNQN